MTVSTVKTEDVEEHIEDILGMMVDGDTIEDMLPSLDALLKLCGSEKTAEELIPY